MRKRTVQLNIRLTESENKRLKQHSRKSGLTASAYVRLLINGFQPKETPPIDYHKLMNSLYELNAKLPQSALERAELQRFILQLQAAVTLPESVKFEEGIK